ncbi:universal stress protein [Nocardioides panacisoli]|uniref:Universal stress protein n=1 Tax=Nocardioides panacisoli TaxID=627624 RepID=A0ABP7I282_9ACTN
MDTTLATAVTGAVVVGADGSTGSDEAARWAAHHAALEHRRLVLVHAIPEHLAATWPSTYAVDVVAYREALLAEAGQTLVALRDRLRKEHVGLDVEEYAVIGDPRDVLAESSRRAALVVVGTRGRGSVRRAILGSVAVSLSRHTHGPLVVVRPGASLPSHRGVLVGVDADPRSQAALEFAFEVASFHHAPLTVVHSTWDADAYVAGASYVPPIPTSPEETKLIVSEVTAGLREKYPDVEVHVRSAHGLPEQELVRLSKDDDLLVVGVRGRGTLAELLVGSTTTAVVEQAQCAVAVVPASAAS